MMSTMLFADTAGKSPLAFIKNTEKLKYNTRRLVYCVSSKPKKLQPELNYMSSMIGNTAFLITYPGDLYNTMV